MGFIPLNSSTPIPAMRRGFTPIDENQDDGQPSAFAPAIETVKDIGRVYPVLETAGNLATQAIAMPVAGLAGLGAAATKALGITDTEPADVVHGVAGAMTYQPQTESGQHLTNAAIYPFEKLQQAGQYVGGKTLDATGSPVLATVADTAVNVLPMALPMKAAEPKGILARAADKHAEFKAAQEVQQVAPEVTAAEIPRAPDHPAAPIETTLARNAQEAITQPDAGLPLTVTEKAPGVPLSQAIDSLALERAIAETPRVATPAPRAGFTPIEEMQARAIPPEVREAPRAIQDAPALDRVHETSAPRPATLEANPLGLPAQQRAIETAAPVLDVPAIASIATVPKSIEAGAARAAMPDMQNADAMPEAARFYQSAHSNIPDAGVTKLPPAEVEVFRAKEAMNAVGVTGVDRTGIIAAVRRGELTAADVAEAYPAKSAGEPATIVPPVRPAEAMGKAIPESRPAEIAAGQEATAQRPRGFTPIDATELPAGNKPLADGSHGAAGSLSVKDMAAPQPVAMAAPRGDTVRNSFAPGANYAPLVNDHPASPTTGAKSVADLPAPIRREKILGEFAKDLGTTIYEGRVKGKKRLGFFRPNLQEVRIKRASDLEVAAHEIGHLLDDRVPAISNAWRSNNKALREELKSISYDQSKVSEGYAEGVRLFLTQPDVLQAKAPAVHAWLENFTNTHQYGPALRKAQEGMTGWFGQDALNRARSKIGEHKPLADYFDGVWDKFRQSTVDDLHGIYRMERDLKGDIAPMGAYETARLSRASHSISDGAIRFGAPVKKANGSFTFKGKGLEEILKPVAENLDDALLYFVGRSSRELQVQGREHLFTMGEVDAMLRLRRPEFETAFKEYQAFNKAVLDFAEAQGVINPEARGMWQRTQYLPFHRVGTMDGFKGKPGDWSGIKALTGGTTNIRDVLGNMVSNAAQLIDKSVKNEARQKIAALANETGGGRFMVKIDAETRPVRIDKAQVLDGLLKAMGIDRHAPGLPKKVQNLIKGLEGDLAKSPGMVELFAGNQPPAGRNVVAVLNGGKPTWYEVGDPVLYRALSAIDRPTQNWVVKWLGLPKRIGQASITLTPDFMVANIARDTIMGSVMSRSGFLPVMDSLQGMRMRMMNDPMYKDFIANGGGMSSIYLDETRFRAKLEKFYQRQGIDYRTVLDTPDKLLNAVETIADAFEMSTRLGEYKRAIEKGENPRHAAYIGREVSTDFAMRGDSQALGALYDTVIFLKAAVVSMDRLYRGVAHDPNKGAIAAKSGLIALASAGLYLMNRDDPRYADLQDWDRDTNWHFFVGDQHFRWPKIWEIGALASIAERTTEKTIASDPQGLGKDFARIVKHTFSLNMMPQAIAPLAEQHANRNSFTNAPIETPGMENMQPFLRAKPTTSETMKAAGMATRDLPESMQVNPVRAEALLRGYLNTWAMYGLALTDNVFFGDKLPERRTDQLPVVRRFYSQEPPPHTKYETMFYDMLGEANRLHGTMRELDKVGLQGIADEKEKSRLATEAKPLGRAADNLSKINADMREVRRSDATPEEKRRRLDELTVERNALLKATVLDAKRGVGNVVR